MKIYFRNTGRVCFSSKANALCETFNLGLYRGVDFSGANLSYGEFTDLSIQNVNLVDVNFNKSTFTNCIFTNCVIDNSSLKKCIFIECKFIDCIITNSDLSKSTWEYLRLTSSKIIDSDLSQAKFITSHWTDCIFQKVDLEGSIVHCIITKTSLSKCDFTRSIIQGTEFRICTISQCDFSSSVKTNVALIECIFHSNWLINKWLSYKHSN